MLKDVKACKKQLLDLTSREFIRDGFILKFNKQGVYKKMPFEKWGIHFGFLNRVYGFETMVNIAVRLDEVEDIVNYHPLNPLINDKERKDTFTVGTNFRVDGRPPIWEIEFEEEIPESAESIVKLIREKGLSFLEYNSRLENIVNTLKDAAAAGKRALTVSFLLNDRDLFEEIAENQKKLLENKNDFRLKDFLILETELRNRGFES